MRKFHSPSSTKVLIAFLALSGFGCGACQLCAADDSFLDKPIENIDPIKVTSFTDWVEKMQTFSGKKVVLPDGVADFLKSHPDINAQFQIGIGKEGGGKLKHYSAREFLDSLDVFSGMKGHYNLAKDAIVLDFPWKNDDTRPNVDLMKIL